mmetsp:Transcript_28996/g.53289  ORF Transcript_28996/g.53289 Transcript_28996/m.53289 type:complete len:519 (-) Transcript_28996:325-1881(-)|eukprot:CAMPEP_0175051658 /NCGR_PEP_ID=MMETSP0052_2-20121109/7931_1 /TAXON_ID=51329 ORGANISM="Polytomella parva, Strain SAG 63-3" /NCGR_SAMPLE_ID=MMETSP0052_2 /ASSEMBLY_ACC=CAM_ASM_000194 /LENGTH=518 /DNA_ID=CAMNT_0016315985 /DNA_START=100 /DNA_END=1656 /DNA_ORIENTATION=+
MPASFGHANGVNLANYRLLQQSSRNQKPGYRAPYEWKMESLEQLNMSTSENKMSSTLREASTILQNQTSAIVQSDLNTVDTAIKSKLNQTESLRAMLEVSLRDVINESTELGLLRAKLEARLSRVMQKLELCDSRQQVRNARPARERTMDEVEKTLLRQQGFLANFSDKVKRALAQVDREVNQLDVVRQRLEADLRDKIDALRVDETILNIPMESDVEGTISRQCSTRVTSPNARESLYGPSMRTPHTWVRCTEENVRFAQHWLQDSQRLRKAVYHAVATTRSAEQDLNDALNISMLAKVGNTRKMHQDLERQLDSVREEQIRAVQQRESLVSALESKKGPLAQAKERLSVRKVRPTRENVSDEVESALAKEVAHLAIVTASLRQKVHSVDKEIEALDLASTMLNENIKDKSSALNVDEQVVLLDGRLSLTVPPPRSVASVSMASVGRGDLDRGRDGRGGSEAGSGYVSSVRAATLQRIRDLETSLQSARVERETLENAVQTLRGTGFNGHTAVALTP